MVPPAVSETAHAPTPGTLPVPLIVIVTSLDPVNCPVAVPDSGMLPPRVGGNWPAPLVAVCEETVHWKLLQLLGSMAAGAAAAAAVDDHVPIYEDCEGVEGVVV